MWCGVSTRTAYHSGQSLSVIKGLKGVLQVILAELRVSLEYFACYAAKEAHLSVWWDEPAYASKCFLKEHKTSHNFVA